MILNPSIIAPGLIPGAGMREQFPQTGQAVKGDAADGSALISVPHFGQWKVACFIYFHIFQLFK
jgi:hypothetical protein